MVIENSVSVKSRLNEQVKDYLMSLHANNEDTKQHYGAMIGFFVDYLVQITAVCHDCSFFGTHVRQIKNKVLYNLGECFA